VQYLNEYALEPLSKMVANVPPTPTTRIPAWVWPTRFRVILGLVIVMILWGWFDVRLRGVVNPNNPGVHKTDFTVYTEAGAAFFDGRDPYSVTNLRGWGYLYLPLFAMLVAPLQALPGEAQVLVWLGLSALMAWGCYGECVRIGRVVLASEPEEGVFGRVPSWIGWAAILAALVPALNCLQRGQVGVAKLYFLLLGFRLLVESRSAMRSLLAGGILALPIVLKVTPLLPVGLVLAQNLLAGWRSQAGALRSAQFAVAGAMAGFVFCVFVLPAGLVGWRTNLQHLDTWWHHVAFHEETAAGGREFAGDSTSPKNQSFANAIRHFGNWADYRFAGGPDDQGPEQLRKGGRGLLMDAPAVNITLKLVAIFELCLLLAVGYRAARDRDLLAQTVTFSLACVATLVIAPIARGHYFVLLLPGTMFVPAWLLREGRARWATVLAILPPVLTLAHYTLMDFTGRIGVLGIGTMLWYTAACLVVLRTSAVAEAQVLTIDWPRASNELQRRKAA